MGKPRDVEDLIRSVGGAVKKLQAKPPKLAGSFGRELTRPVGGLKPRGLSVAAEDAMAPFPQANRRKSVPGVFGTKTGVSAPGARAFSGRARVRFGR